MNDVDRRKVDSTFKISRSDFTSITPPSSTFQSSTDHAPSFHPRLCAQGHCLVMRRNDRADCFSAVEVTLIPGLRNRTHDTRLHLPKTEWTGRKFARGIIA